jgi:hypothetical protein
VSLLAKLLQFTRWSLRFMVIIARKRIVDGVTEANLGEHRLAEPWFQPGKKWKTWSSVANMSCVLQIDRTCMRVHKLGYEQEPRKNMERQGIQRRNDSFPMVFPWFSPWYSRSPWFPHGFSICLSPLPRVNSPPPQALQSAKAAAKGARSSTSRFP